MNKKVSSIWPDGKKFAICLTHDIDRVKKTYQYLTHFAKTLRPYHLISVFYKEEPYWNFEKIIKLEKRYGVRSTFFFLNETKKLNPFHPGRWSLSLGRYSFQDEKIAEIIQKLYANGWEIGLHGSYESYKDKNLLKKERKELEAVLGDEITGIRQHYLNLDIPRTWKIQQEVGFKYDASFGYRDKIGFRDRKYLPFHPFNGSTFLEIPLAIMDVALFRNSRNVEDAWKKCVMLINETEKHNGLLAVVWHQRVFNEKEFYGYSMIYERIIQKGITRDAWIGSVGEIAKWWENK